MTTETKKQVILKPRKATNVNIRDFLDNLDIKHDKKIVKDKKALKHISLTVDNNEKQSKVDEQKQRKKQTKESNIHLTL